jgi:uncharacterized membrane protein
LIAVLLVVLIVLYPILTWIALQHATTRTVAFVPIGVFAILAVAAFFSGEEFLRSAVRRFAVLVLFALAAIAFDDPLGLKLLPAVSHLWLFLMFGATLVKGPPFAEQFVRRAHHGDCPEFLAPYTRLVTAVWCVFFAANAVLYTWLAVAAPTRAWALYTGFGCYVLIFALVAGEYVFHKVWFRYYENGWTDRIWRRICPPERSVNGRRSLAWQQTRRSQR